MNTAERCKRSRTGVTVAVYNPSGFSQPYNRHQHPFCSDLVVQLPKEKTIFFSFR